MPPASIMYGALDTWHYRICHVRRIQQAGGYKIRQPTPSDSKCTRKSKVHQIYHARQQSHLGKGEQKAASEVSIQPAPRVCTRTDLSTLSGNLYVSNTYQNTFVDVNEERTKAAGVITIIIIVDKIPSSPSIKFTANHPFIFAIQDDETCTILFMG